MTRLPSALPPAKKRHAWPATPRVAMPIRGPPPRRERPAQYPINPH
jgi:hypothetical protein